MHIKQAQSIKELYHELWILFNEMREVYKDPYAELDGSKEDTSLLEGRVYAFEKCLDLIQEVYDTCSIQGEQLKSIIKPIWENQLTDLTESGKYDNFHLIVSVRKIMICEFTVMEEALSAVVILTQSMCSFSGMIVLDFVMI